MACQRCGSEWKTLKGKDMVSCPECCKQQRCKARKQGRLPASETKACERCGQAFHAAGGNAMARRCYCTACTSLARVEYLADRKAQIDAGQWIPKLQPKHCGRGCVRCGRLLGKNQVKYCGRGCFFLAREEGTQAWMHNLHPEAVWHRGGRWASAPSRKPVHEMRTNMQRFLNRIRKVYRKALPRLRPCKACQCDCESRFCSDACRQVHRENAAIRKRQAKRRYQKVAGRHFKQRAKRYGVAYERFAKSLVYHRDNYTCQLCNEPVLKTVQYRKSDGKIHMKSPTLDHIIPMSKGGDHKPHNCQTACFECNSKKGNRMIGQLRLALT